MNLHTTIDLDLNGFLQWWGKELAFLVPAGLRRALRERNGNLIFEPDGSGFAVGFQREQAQQPVLRQRIEYADRAAYQQFNAQHPEFGRAEIVLRLTDAHALRKIIYLPAVAQENLEQVVRFELDRYTPFKPDQVYFAAIMLAKTETGLLKVLLLLSPKVVLDSQLAHLQALGVRPQRVTFAQADTDFPQSAGAYNLLPERYRERGNWLSQSLHWLLNLLLLTLLLAAMVQPVWQESQAVERLKSELKALEKQTHTVEAQQLEIDALHNETQKLIGAKRQSPALLDVLNELSTLLNDDTWLTHLQYADKHLQIQGQSPTASALIGVLEASEFFSNVSFVSPLTQDKLTGRERFQISMDVAMPAALTVDEPVVDDEIPADTESAADTIDPGQKSSTEVVDE